MSRHRTTARAAEAIPFGYRVLISKADNVCRVTNDSIEMSGIARRQWGVGDKRSYETGEMVDIQLEGSILADFGGGNTLTVKLHRGKIVG